ncbi:unnamed protein product [Caenorhabditis brenneri]
MVVLRYPILLSHDYTDCDNVYKQIVRPFILSNSYNGYSSERIMLAQHVAVSYNEPSLPHEVGQRDGVIILLFMFLYLFIIMAVGVVTIYQVRKRLSRVLDQHADLLRRMPKIAIVNNCVYALFLFWQFIASWELKPKMEFMLTASDTMTFSAPYILLCLDSNVRMALRNSVGNVSFSRLSNVRISVSGGRQNNFTA